MPTLTYRNAATWKHDGDGTTTRASTPSAHDRLSSRWPRRAARWNARIRRRQGTGPAESRHGTPRDAPRTVSPSHYYAWPKCIPKGCSTPSDTQREEKARACSRCAAFLGLKAGVDGRIKSAKTAIDYRAKRDFYYVGADGRASTTPVGRDDRAAAVLSYPPSRIGREIFFFPPFHRGQRCVWKEIAQTGRNSSSMKKPNTGARSTSSNTRMKTSPPSTMRGVLQILRRR